MKIQNLEELYVDVLKDLYDAEQQIMKALPKMAKAAHSTELRQGFEEHLTQTERQAARLEQIFSAMDTKPGGKKCIGMEGLIKEGEEIMKEAKKPSDVLDAGLIAAAQKVEHYEISGYGTARTYAQLLGESDAAELLQQTLEEEALTDEKLNQLAEGFINLEAMA
ncbi:MAG: ferritin-like domain-containing protein [Chloroflexota bacterium]